MHIYIIFCNKNVNQFLDRFGIELHSRKRRKSHWKSARWKYLSQCVSLSFSACLSLSLRVSLSLSQQADFVKGLREMTSLSQSNTRTNSNGKKRNSHLSITELELLRPAVPSPLSTHKFTFVNHPISVFQYV